MESANNQRPSAVSSVSASQTEVERLSLAFSEIELRMAERTKELANSVALLEATFDSSSDGIAATRLSGEPICRNKKCAEIWQIPPNFDELSVEEQKAHVASQLEYPEQQGIRGGEASENSGIDSFSVLQMKDGRVLEVHKSPILIDGECVGRVGNYRDVTERRRAQSEIERIHAQLMEASRWAGKAEIATNVLHNVGNVLNSVNVSASLVKESITSSKIDGFAKAAALLQEHEHEVGDYLGNDPRGKLLPGYLIKLAKHLQTDRDATLKELKSLTENIEHIKEIVAMQQSYAVASNTKQSVNISDVLEEALRVNIDSLTRHDLQVVREVEDVPPIRLDKHQALQILVNLLGNAKQACLESGQKEKCINLAIKGEGDRVMISVTDNGVGIPPENLTKIFNHGFTTRKDGHGFGLHSAALTAKQMGGVLRAESQGLGKGATFILELPIEPVNSL